MGENTNLADEIQPVIGNPIVSVSKNIEQNCIITTEDKLHIIFDEYNSAKKASSDALGWLGIFVALLIADFTCSFHDVLFMDSATVRAMFYLATLFFFIRSIQSGINYLKNREKLSFDSFIGKIKGSLNKIEEDSSKKSA